MKSNNKSVGILLITGAIALLIPYTMLTIVFEYPDILRQDTGTILTRFYQGGKKRKFLIMETSVIFAKTFLIAIFSDTIFRRSR